MIFFMSTGAHIIYFESNILLKGKGAYFFHKITPLKKPVIGMKLFLRISHIREHKVYYDICDLLLSIKSRIYDLKM